MSLVGRDIGSMLPKFWRKRCSQLSLQGVAVEMSGRLVRVGLSLRHLHPLPSALLTSLFLRVTVTPPRQKPVRCWSPHKGYRNPEKCP